MYRQSVSRTRTLALAAALAVPALAGAQQLAYTSAQLHLRAGPSPSYPVVALLHPGVAVHVQGCVADYSWCDVQVDGAVRGWVYAQYLHYPQAGPGVPFANAAVSIGIPVLAFTLGTYWGSHYRDRPWYHSPQWNPHPSRPPAMRPPQHRPPHWNDRPRPPRPDMRPPPRPHPHTKPTPPPGGNRPHPGAGGGRPDGGRPGGGGHRP